MIYPLWLSDKFNPGWEDFMGFVKSQASRLAFGKARYGKIGNHKKYMTRIGLELKEYKKTGNREHLLNIANYAWLESQAPENNKFHWDSTVDSATRGKV